MNPLNNSGCFTITLLVGLLISGIPNSPVSGAEPMPPIYPPALVPGDTIAFVAPAGNLNKERMQRAQKRLEEMGFKVSVPNNLYRTRGYLAGSDEERSNELMKAFKNPEIKAIFPGTGYYGATRILDRLDYDVIRKNPKILIGFSDITALHLAVNRKTGLITFHSPNPMYGLGSKGGLSDFSTEYFWRSFLQEKQFNADTGKLDDKYTFFVPQSIAELKVIAPGKGQGRLVGGNLSLVCALMGTDYEIDTNEKVLFLEDVGERPYRLDRYLSQLRLGESLRTLEGYCSDVSPIAIPRRMKKAFLAMKSFETISATWVFR